MLGLGSCGADLDFGDFWLERATVLMHSHPTEKLSRFRSREGWCLAEKDAWRDPRRLDSFIAQMQVKWPFTKMDAPVVLNVPQGQNRALSPADIVPHGCTSAPCHHF